MGNSACCLIVINEPKNAPAVAKIVVNETDSFVNPEKFKIIKNLINVDLNMFKKYLNDRRTVGDTDLHTRELKILIDNGLFAAAYMYESKDTYRWRSRYWDVDYSVVLANRPVSLQRYTANADNFKYIIVNWVAIIAADIGTTQLYLDFLACHRGAMFNYLPLEDPRLTYAKVKTFLNDLLARNRITIEQTTHKLASIGAFRAARVVLEYKGDYRTWDEHARRLYAIEPFNVPPSVYTDLTKADYYGAFGFLAEMNQELYDAQVEKIDWNTIDARYSNRAVFLSDAAFERAMNMVWKDNYVNDYREQRARHRVKTV